ncbi:MAG: glutathione S-transferase family protein [Pseudohongiella sp.]|uniref:glutathione S-transferase family protein n=1 Tax=Pseudohongiella sp. TaxID=1979412 RepID=UPI0034A08B7A
MQTVLFYGVPQGCSFGAIVALEWLQQPYYLSRVEMLDQPWDSRFGALNPLYKTPSLLVVNDAPDGNRYQVINESLAILLHIASRDLVRNPQFSQGSEDYDALNQMLSYLVTDFFAAFAPLWTAYEMGDADPKVKAVLREVGTNEVVRCCEYLDRLLADQQWLLGRAGRSVADAYLAGIARWIDYHQLFDVEKAYPSLHFHLQELQRDPAVRLATAIEKNEFIVSGSTFKGHLTLDDLNIQSFNNRKSA